MSTGETFALGAIAGSTILLGLPMARMRLQRIEPRAAMTSVATGILVFLLWDVLTNGVEPVTSSLDARHWGMFAARAALLAVGFAVGLMGLVYYDHWIKTRRASPLVGPGAAAIDEFRSRGLHALSATQRIAFLIATGIGIHNFGEGLAIGQSAAAGKVSLALVLIIGFGLHNATEGFAVAGPLAHEEHPVSWRYLALLGLIGGGPTFLGTVIGHSWVSESLQVFFFALAAGSILYVVMELAAVCRRFSMPVLVAWMILIGIALGFATDFVLTAAGA
ncbi:MAG: zinc permease [Actinobacteria bacterium]|nr:zinc permease [Actinomycetota bacterium]MBV8394940.1 zinc permease [Actinomycetota bacterium]MBV8597726.1 zinc permease [Actinomycetota bacterium]